MMPIVQTFTQEVNLLIIIIIIIIAGYLERKFMTHTTTHIVNLVELELTAHDISFAATCK
jgi:flagellar biogenesis protein FliO